VVGSWLEIAQGPVLYGDTPLDRSQFLSWSELRQMQASGLVEIASHSFDLHRGIAGNPQGDPQPAAVTRAYDTTSSRYEDDVSYQRRIHEDLERNSALLAQRLGKRPRVMVWPYGAHSAETVAIAKELGMELTLTLLEGAGQLDNLQQVPRHLALNDPKLEEWLYSLRADKPRRPLRVMHLDLDYVYDADPVQQRRNLDALLERVKAFRITHVFLQAYADPDGDGVADSLYFPNRHLPVRADLFSHVAWRLYTRSAVQVFAWMPMLAFALPDAERSARLAVKAVDRPATDPGDYHRLSPFLPESRRLIQEIYADLGRFAQINGVLFHDDGYLRDYEDAHAPGLSAAQKTQALVQFSHALADEVRHYRPDLKTARNLYPRLVLQPQSQAWFAQSLPAFLDAYDYTAVMAMPGLESRQAPAYGWLKELAERALEVAGAQEKLLFELQSVDWQRRTPIPTEQLIRQLRVLSAAGIRHLGYYPDDFIADHPRMARLKEAFSAADFPYHKR
jgi:biofilm PGA synthesis lipoprotein PgaB